MEGFWQKVVEQYSTLLLIMLCFSFSSADFSFPIPNSLAARSAALAVALVVAFFPNAASAEFGVVINEIHYDAEPKTDFVEFIELLNTAATSVDLSNWSFTNGVKFSFPEGTLLGAGEYLIVAEDPIELTARFPAIPEGTQVFQYTGSLASEGEKIELVDASVTAVDEVDYRVRFPWPIGAGGDGGSMELIHPGLDNDLGSSWRTSLAPGNLPEATLLPAGSSWMIRRGEGEASDPVDAWRMAEFVEDGSWFNGESPIGFGSVNDVEFNTILSEMQNVHTGVFARTTFDVTNGEIPSRLLLRWQVDDGLLIWINGVEVVRFQVEGDPSFTSTATRSSSEGEWGGELLENIGGYITEGANTIAVQAFNASLGGSDFGFDVEVIRPAPESDPLAQPTPGSANSVFSDNAPPNIRQVKHSPEAPTSVDGCTITAKVTDPDGVGSVQLLYQVVAPGSFIPAYLPHDYSDLLRNPDAAQEANPDFENADNWSTIAMVDDGTGGDESAADGMFSVQIPAQSNRNLVRYRIIVEDGLNESVRVPYADDDSLNFAYFVYNGVPDYGAGDTTHDATMLTALPVYTMITRDADREFAYAYSSAGDSRWQIPKGHQARRTYNWECVLVYDGIVYDHVGWRLRQNNDRYAGNGKRSMRYRLNRGHQFQARGEDGERLSVKWRRFSTSKMSRFGGTNSYGFHETINSRLWRMVGVECPYFLPAHFRMIDGADEAPDQFNGDFFGFTTIVQDIDGRLLDERGLPDGNIYKLKDGVTRPLDLQRNQSRTAVTDGSDLNNIKSNLDSSQTTAWLNDHVDWNQWTRYHAVVEAVRHYDYGTPSSHFKNRAWYFKEQAGTPQGLLRIIPHDHDASWAKGYHDNLNSTGNSIGTGFPWAAIFDTIRRPPTGEEKSEFTIDYRNFIRDFRQLLWQEETVATMIDNHVALLENFSLADQARWTRGPVEAGREAMTPIARIATEMKAMAFTSDTVYGSNLAGGRGAFLDQIAADPDIPGTPTISYSGSAGFPIGGLGFTSSDFSDPQGDGTFGKMEWRVAEIANIAAPVSILQQGSNWKFLDDGTDRGEEWRAVDFADDEWKSGATPAGYGNITDTTLATNVSYGDDLGDKHITTYFRTSVTIDDLSLIESFVVTMNVDDGAVVYVNGEEVVRDGFDSDTIVGFMTPADSAGNEGVYDPFEIPVTHFVNGSNAIAVEVHQDRPTSSDLAFDMGISALPISIKEVFEWNASWESGEVSNFASSINPPAAATRTGKTYRARVRHQDDTGRWSQWSEPLEFTATLPDISLLAESLVVSEIMYHPSAPSPAEIAAGFDDDDFFEFIEIRNIGDRVLDLSGVRFTKGIDIDLSGSIAPGGYVLVVNHVAAFEMRYGAGLPVVGAWSGKLDNGGEQLKLSFGAGESIRDFVYDDGAPWPVGEAEQNGPDGGGGSLVLVAPQSLPAHANAINWRTSTTSGGNPGSTDGTTFPGGSDAEFLAYATRSLVAIDVLPDGTTAFTVEVNRLADDVNGTIEVSENLIDWQPGQTLMPPTKVEPTTQGFARITFRSPQPPVAERRFIRYKVQQQ
ncbi:MAG: hypothetical protein ACI9R3_002183 [Verrucomicrobiales bacterium]